MLEYIVLGFGEIFTITNLVAIFIGVAIGTLLGAIPGLTATMGIAIVLPMTYAMSPITAISMLLGAYKGGLFGGSMPAIYLNTPGTPAAVATVLDGYPMTKRGEAGRAMSMTLYVSVISDFIGTLSLILLGSLLINVALRFGPPEFSTLILFSLTLVATLSAESLIKGMISASIGFLIAMVGLDSMSGASRFTFNISYLMGGLDLMVVMIGLFAVSEILLQATKRDDATMTVSGKTQPSTSKISWKEFKTYIKTIIRGSIIGIFIGAIPGLGATPAAFFSYSEARRTSKNPENYGKGELDGVVAAESANNSTCGSTMIPTLALGIPGNVTAAVLLGGLMIHGLVPGPSLFEDQPLVIYAIFAGKIVSCFMLWIIGSQAIKAFTLITKIPSTIVFPMAFIFCIVGTFGINLSIIDVYIMGLFGLLGYFLRKYAIPLSPLLITFILTPIFERSVRRSLTISRGSFMIFFERPISLFFIFLTIIGVILAKRLQENIKAKAKEAKENA